MNAQSWFSVFTKLLGLVVLLRAAEMLLGLILVSMRGNQPTDPDNAAWMVVNSLGCAVGFALIRKSQWIAQLAFDEPSSSPTE